MFRLLKATEIECRVATVKEKGLSLLLYKDARCDMNILDESVGNMNWKRHHKRDNANCIVSIWDKDKSQWIDKEDTGAESFTEKEKGLASDSFKRACFNWGIGRELYTAPFIWVTKADIKGNNGKFTTYDKFEVVDIGYDDNRVINKLMIRNLNSKEIVYTLNTDMKVNFEKKETPPGEETTPKKTNLITESQVKLLYGKATGKDKNLIVEILKNNGFTKFAEVTKDKINVIIGEIEKL